MSEERLVLIERRVSDLSGTFERFDKKLDTLGDSLQTLVRIEERQITMSEKLGHGTQTMMNLDSRIRVIEQSLPENLDKRLSVIEIKLPPLIESRKWMILGILGTLGLIGENILHYFSKS